MRRPAGAPRAHAHVGGAQLRPAGGAGRRGDPLPDGFDAVKRMAVRIRNVGCSSLSTGSGFALDARTLITNKHVVEGPGRSRS
ncbi:hypothetical protein NKG05_00035 [Oerskovia sp. M15]